MDERNRRFRRGNSRTALRNFQRKTLFIHRRSHQFITWTHLLACRLRCYHHFLGIFIEFFRKISYLFPFFQRQADVEEYSRLVLDEDEIEPVEPQENVVLA